jgi:phage shock protein A
MIDRRLPLHVAVLVGASTAAYAVSMAGVTALQSNTDQALILARSPSQDAAARITAAHDQLQTQIELSAGAYAGSAATYDELTAGLTSLDTSLQKYAKRMAKVSGAARAMPGRVSMPGVSRSATSSSSSSSSTKPRVAASTAASGAP